MVTLYLWNARGIYLHSMDADPAAAMPQRSTTTPPPTEMPQGHVAIWVGHWSTGPEPAALEEAQLPEDAPQVPAEVMRWQAVRALRLTSDPNAPERSCLQTVQALRDAMEPGELRDDVDDALGAVINWRRASPTLCAMAAAAGWPDDFVDSLFISAAGYEL